MVSVNPQDHPQELHGPSWHETAQTPIVDGKYYDPTSGELRVLSGAATYSGPPAVDIIVQSIHEDTGGCVLRTARPFRVEALLWQVMKVVHDRSLQIDSVMATAYAIRIVLAHELTVEEFHEISQEMTNMI